MPLARSGTDKIHVSKKPLYCGRVGTLIEAFPDARIVLLVRNQRHVDGNRCRRVYTTNPTAAPTACRGLQRRQCDESDGCL